MPTTYIPGITDNKPPASGGAANSGKPDNLTWSNTVNKAAQKWHVPVAILWGVFGLETGFGTNIATSSANAKGAFQFIPSTAQAYGYPETNTPTEQQFQQQADAAAHYLHDLYHQYGNWNSAITHYSGGGYGLSQVVAKYQSKPGLETGGTIPGETLIQKIATGSVGDAAASVQKALSAPEAFLKLLTSLEFWLRLGEGIAGLVLIAMGLKSLTGVELPNVVPVPV